MNIFDGNNTVNVLPRGLHAQYYTTVDFVIAWKTSLRTVVAFQWFVIYSFTTCYLVPKGMRHYIRCRATYCAATHVQNLVNRLASNIDVRFCVFNWSAGKKAFDYHHTWPPGSAARTWWNHNGHRRCCSACRCAQPKCGDADAEEIVRHAHAWIESEINILESEIFCISSTKQEKKREAA